MSREERTEKTRGVGGGGVKREWLEEEEEEEGSSEATMSVCAGGGEGEGMCVWCIPCKYERGFCEENGDGRVGRCLHSSKMCSGGEVERVPS
jgi:hypothetical protein